VSILVEWESIGKERKGIYIAPCYYACIVSKHSDMDHIVLPANTPCQELAGRNGKARK